MALIDLFDVVAANPKSVKSVISVKFNKMKHTKYAHVCIYT